MLARYAHIRVQARREAIATLEQGAEIARPFGGQTTRVENWAQSPPTGERLPRWMRAESLEILDFELVGVAGFEPATTRTPSENDEES